MPQNPFSNSAGPLAALQDQGYQLSNFTYPIDLTSDPAEQHFVVFYINESSNTQFQTINGQVIFNGGQSPVPTNSNGQQAQATINEGGQLTNFKRPIRRVTSAIALYMPPRITTTHEMVWDSVSGNAAAGIISAAKNGSLKAALSEMGLGVAANLADDAKDVMRSALGADVEIESGVSFFTRAVRNPYLEMLFRTIGFRQYQFDFKFTPRSEQEAIVVGNIIKAFRFYSVPEVRDAAGSPRYYIYPAEFDIEFWSNGEPNNFVNRISTCACTNISTDYTASNGWSAFRKGQLNGVPVEINLSLQFQELEIITKKRILQGF